MSKSVTGSFTGMRMRKWDSVGRREASSQNQDSEHNLNNDSDSRTITPRRIGRYGTESSEKEKCKTQNFEQPSESKESDFINHRMRDRVFREWFQTLPFNTRPYNERLKERDSWPKDDFCWKIYLLNALDCPNDVKQSLRLSLYLKYPETTTPCRRLRIPYGLKKDLHMSNHRTKARDTLRNLASYANQTQSTKHETLTPHRQVDNQSQLFPYQNLVNDLTQVARKSREVKSHAQGNHAILPNSNRGFQTPHSRFQSLHSRDVQNNPKFPFSQSPDKIPSKILGTQIRHPDSTRRQKLDNPKNVKFGNLKDSVGHQQRSGSLPYYNPTNPSLVAQFYGSLVQKTCMVAPKSTFPQGSLRKGRKTDTLSYGRRIEDHPQRLSMLPSSRTMAIGDPANPIIFPRQKLQRLRNLDSLNMDEFRSRLAHLESPPSSPSLSLSASASSAPREYKMDTEGGTWHFLFDPSPPREGSLSTRGSRSTSPVGSGPRSHHLDETARSSSPLVQIHPSLEIIPYPAHSHRTKPAENGREIIQEGMIMVREGTQSKRRRPRGIVVHHRSAMPQWQSNFQPPKRRPGSQLLFKKFAARVVRQRPHLKVSSDRTLGGPSASRRSIHASSSSSEHSSLMNGISTYKASSMCSICSCKPLSIESDPGFLREARKLEHPPLPTELDSPEYREKLRDEWLDWFKISSPIEEAVVPSVTRSNTSESTSPDWSKAVSFSFDTWISSILNYFRGLIGFDGAEGPSQGPEPPPPPLDIQNLVPS